jgi:hypothetical protein
MCDFLLRIYTTKISLFFLALPRPKKDEAGVPLSIFFCFCHQQCCRVGKNQKKDFRSTPNAGRPLTKFAEILTKNWYL